MKENKAMYTLRMSENLKELVQKVAKQEGRSFNSEIIQRVIRSLKEDGLIDTQIQ
ncbi:Arc family DNA-binding protein [Xenorhabdus bovienii]|uniref:Arc family DNA-binding protein n=1 Tax=Xenorhabdus bovienii TaxID=40576 RepID=UPI0020CA8659|nr:Arc family DNA-binding protein [Xenorhabdus bovienii]MCP9269889.1 Arc family DNA-binding protein [Xenorhabdus bovienii subsp. africana]MDE1494898.1 Arc family DNA-binding protein [Xenorhabdus bovienii]MDE9473485.1 Arc family DNA-binding protein [Xenorhabdus bovienii]MDE9495845.1 Arc family DNA-binding protein [Xenorhabdus bovienii]MDE9504195.1 Arc family DNA-binding protein [Xenorhabdus bovienii]